MISVNPRLRDLYLLDNSADCDGGGIYCEGSSPLLERVRFEGNYADDGAALYCRSGSHPVLRHCTLARNTAIIGGAIYCRDSYLTLQQVTISLNVAAAGGALLLRDGGHAFIENCILWNNSPEEIRFFASQDSNQVEVSCSDLTGGEEAIEISGNGEVIWGDDNIDLDPLFCDPETADLRLDTDSPCRTETCGLMGATGETCAGEAVPDVGTTGRSPLPHGITLARNYPNPFNPATTIEFELVAPQPVRLEVFNLRGESVTLLGDESLAAGTHRVRFNGSTFASGVYIYRLSTRTAFVSRKMVLVR